ncbi:MAG: Arc family DNA-binding protein [Candidatus Aminicenantales bacterium]
MSTTITVKNIPPDLYEKLKLSAALHHRSINSEVIALIEAGVAAKKRKPEDFLASARAIRERTGRYGLKQEFIDKAKREGRP